LNVNSSTFVVTKDTKQATVAVSLKKLGEGAVQAASGTGGFGNRQTAHAFDDKNKVIYRDILVHDLHVSIQEYQKKSKMYQKKVMKKRHQELINAPEIQYMNIYKQTIKRLGVFEDITTEFDNSSDSDIELRDVDVLFYGDATSYENYLD